MDLATEIGGMRHQRGQHPGQLNILGEFCGTLGFRSAVRTRDVFPDVNKLIGRF